MDEPTDADRQAADMLRQLREAAGLPGPISLLGAGQFNDAYLVGRLVVRVPRHRVGVEQLRQEVELLRLVGARLPCEIPQPQIVELDEPVGRAFVAHEMVPGVVLTRAAVARLATPAREAIAAQVASFLSVLHGLDALGVEAGLPILSLSELSDSLRTRTNALLGGHLASQASREIDVALDRLAAASSDSRVLCHGDIGGNVVVASDASVGIIDFGLAIVSHSAVDAASIGAALGVEFLDDVASAYPALGTGPRTLEAVQGTYALQDILWSAEQADWARVGRLVNELNASSA